MQQNKLAKLFKSMILMMALVFLVQARFNKTYPDALRCGQGREALYIMHDRINEEVSYCQIYSGQSRCVGFSLNGTYKFGTGHEQSRAGCSNKNFADLKAEGRAFDIEDSQKIKQLEDKIAILESKIMNLTNLNFWDYEQLKQKWFHDFQTMLLQKIQQNGIMVGSRWRIAQESSYLVFRDMQGTKKKDSRYAMSSDSYVDIR